jgi:ribulose-phosphate 3-epimerase
MDHLVAPSILAADFGHLEKEISMLNKSLSDWVHLDIMDGVFVPNISFGFPVIEYIKKLSEKPLDVHLMIVDPDKYLSRFRDSGADILTVHYEACIHLNRTVSEIKKLGLKAGVSLNPHTPVSLLKNILPFIDMVLVMSVNPGFGNQSFIHQSCDKVRELKHLIDDGGYNVLIEVDGGVDLTNAAELYKAGTDVLVAGTSVFKAKNPAGFIKKLKTIS